MKQKKNTAVSRKERKVRRLMFCAAGAAAMVIIVYVFGAYPFYTKSKISTIKEVYEGISEMTLAALEEEDEEQLRSYSGENLNIVIANSSFATVYSSRSKGTKEQIRGYIESHIEDYQEVPVVDVQKNEEMRIIRMRGRLQQEQPYYVYIRKELRGAGEMIFYTTLYMIICAAAGLGVLYALMKREQRTAASCAKGYEAQEGAEPQVWADGAGAHIDQQFPSLSTADAAHMERVQKEFVANVSHELKTPLTSISGTAEIMANGLVKQEDIPHFANNIYKESQRLITLVGDIIKLSKLEEMDMTEQKEMVDLAEVVTSVTESLQIPASKKSISLIVQMEPCMVWGIPSILNEIVYNLCDNAVKYNVEKGTVYVKLEKKDKRVCLTVEDTGIGIPREEQERIFERFYRVDKSHSKDIGGTGLGLSIVKHGVAYHNAELKLESEVGKGTKITILF